MEGDEEDLGDVGEACCEEGGCSAAEEGVEAYCEEGEVAAPGGGQLRRSWGRAANLICDER